MDSIIEKTIFNGGFCNAELNKKGLVIGIEGLDIKKVFADTISLREVDKLWTSDEITKAMIKEIQTGLIFTEHLPMVVESMIPTHQIIERIVKDCKKDGDECFNFKTKNGEDSYLIFKSSDEVFVLAYNKTIRPVIFELANSCDTDDLPSAKPRFENVNANYPLYDFVKLTCGAVETEDIAEKFVKYMVRRATFTFGQFFHQIPEFDIVNHTVLRKVITEYYGKVGVLNQIIKHDIKTKVYNSIMNLKAKSRNLEYDNPVIFLDVLKEMRQLYNGKDNDYCLLFFREHISTMANIILFFVENAAIVIEPYVKKQGKLNDIVDIPGKPLKLKKYIYDIYSIDFGEMYTLVYLDGNSERPNTFVILDDKMKAKGMKKAIERSNLDDFVKWE